MWSGTQRQLLDLILDELIPPGSDGRVPGAGAARVADFFPSAVRYAPDPVGAITTVLATVAANSPDFASLDRAGRVAVLKEAESEEPDSFATLVRLTYMGYYSRPDIRPLFGVGAHAVHPEGYPVENGEAERLAELTEPVRARGAIHRD